MKKKSKKILDAKYPLDLKKKFFFIFTLVPLFIFSQSSINGKVTYISTYKKKTLSSENKNNNEAHKRVEELLKNAYPVEFTLIFSNNESIYKKNIKLDNESNKGINITEIFAGGDDVYYHNSETNACFAQKNMQGDFFILTKEIYDWELTKELKKIGEFNCYLAISKNNTNVKAWYTPEIPVQHGPLNYNGLPGLILELENKVSLFKTKDITLSKEKIKIKRPTKGKKVTLDEFKKIFGGVF